MSRYAGGEQQLPVVLVSLCTKKHGILEPSNDSGGRKRSTARSPEGVTLLSPPPRSFKRGSTKILLSGQPWGKRARVTLSTTALDMSRLQSFLVLELGHEKNTGDGSGQGIGH